MFEKAELRRPHPAIYLLAGVFAVILCRTAWVSDDAFITFRTVDNLLSGYGLRWNVVERVQSYTHPLWMFAIAAGQWVTGEPYFTTLALSALFTLVAVIAIIGLADSPAAAIVGVALLICSKAFVDYSTSGLENPLTHALLAGFWLVAWRYPDRAGLLGVMLAFILLNRMDCVLLVAPAVALAVVQRRSWGWSLRFAAGLAPFAVWEIFSVIYYGVPFPNTAYAKLASTGLGRRDLLRQAVLYFQDSLARDPVTLCTIAGVMAWAGVRRRLNEFAFAAGLLLYVVYIARIGGDFMSGRFLAAPFFMAVLFIVHQRFGRWVTPGFATVAAAAAVIAIAPRTNFSGGHFGEGNQLTYIGSSGISDERGFYYQWTGLLPVLHGTRIAETPWALEGRALASQGPRVVPSRSVGIVGYYAGPAVHVVDIYALCDPLLARLPSTDAWRIGHFERRLPDGYLETLATGRNTIREPGLAELQRRLEVITRDPVWSRRRFETAVALNLEGYDELVAPWRSTARTPRPLQALGSLH